MQRISGEQRKRVRKTTGLLRLYCMRTLIALLLLAATTAQAATTINVGTNVVVPGVKRFGVSGISHYYYDRVLLKNMVWHNAGFEGLLFQSVIRCGAAGTPT